MENKSLSAQSDYDLRAYPDAFSEDIYTDDLFHTHISFDLESLLADTGHKAIIGIIGDYGSGKSVSIRHYKQQTRHGEWVHFDAWKYPDRKDMWDGFVLDLAKQLLPKEFDRVLAALDGTQQKDLKQLIRTSSKALDHFVPGAGIVGDLAYFAAKSPATRIFQIQELLKSLIEKVGNDITIVLEDIDRSGNAGLYFIESLATFLKTTTIKEPIKVLIPIASSSFEANQDSYIKSLDYSFRFAPRRTNFNEFVTKTFSPEVWQGKGNRLIQIEEWLAHLVNECNVNLRFLKFILRESNIRYKLLTKDGYNPDPFLTIIFTSARYIPDYNTPEISLMTALQSLDYISPDFGFISEVLWAIGRDIPIAVAKREIADHKISEDTRTIVVIRYSPVEQKKMTTPMVHMQRLENEDDSEYGLPSCYLD